MHDRWVCAALGICVHEFLSYSAFFPLTVEFWGAKLGQAPGERDSERGESHICVCLSGGVAGGGKILPGFLAPRTAFDPGWGQRRKIRKLSRQICFHEEFCVIYGPKQDLLGPRGKGAHRTVEGAFSAPLLGTWHLGESLRPPLGQHQLLWALSKNVKCS